MSIRATYQRCCDRCNASMGDPLDAEPDGDELAAEDPLISLEAIPFGVELKTMRDLCDKCRKVIPTLLEQVVSATPPKKGGKKKNGDKK